MSRKSHCPGNTGRLPRPAVGFSPGQRSGQPLCRPRRNETGCPAWNRLTWFRFQRSGSDGLQLSISHGVPERFGRGDFSTDLDIATIDCVRSIFCPVSVHPSGPHPVSIVFLRQPFPPSFCREDTLARPVSRRAVSTSRPTEGSVLDDSRIGLCLCKQPRGFRTCQPALFPFAADG